MSSSQPFQASSPLHEANRKKSRFTYRHLAKLAASATNCPLRVTAHVDLDAFYAQCEMVRLGVAEDQPLAVQQWQGLIALNYPSRKYGLTRMITPTEAKKLCPNLIMQHVATWKEGDEKWAYHEDAAKNIGTHKVSLDPYRRESKRILTLIKETLPANLQRVEKAGIDEVFLDLSAQVHSIMLERYPELAAPPPYDDPTEYLPVPPTTALDWQADALIDLDTEETEDDDPDWDDIAILIGSEIVRDVRAAIRKTLKFTCSGGIAHNKMLAKLGSAHKKPNQQTAIRNRAVQQFMSGFKFTKIRGLGGKLGEQIASTWDTETVERLLEIPLDQLKQKLGDDTGTWVYGIIRGQDSSEVDSRTQIKSMLSAKSFQPSINTPEQAVRWLRIFVADIYSRLVEEGVLENKKRPRVMNLHHRQGGQMRSRQGPIPSGKKMSEEVLFDVARSLLRQIIAEGRVWPCANLSLSVGDFEDGPVGNMGIGAFLVKGEDAQSVRDTKEPAHLGISHDRPEKRRRVEVSGGIQRFLVKTESVDEHDDEFGAQQLQTSISAEKNVESYGTEQAVKNLPYENEASKTPRDPFFSAGSSALHQQRITQFTCSRCNQGIESAEAFQSHEDWHFARDLQDQERARPIPPSKTPTHSATQTPSSSKKSGPDKLEKGQRRLAFG